MISPCLFSLDIQTFSSNLKYDLQNIKKQFEQRKMNLISIHLNKPEKVSSVENEGNYIIFHKFQLI